MALPHNRRIFDMAAHRPQGECVTFIFPPPGPWFSLMVREEDMPHLALAPGSRNMMRSSAQDSPVWGRSLAGEILAAAQQENREDHALLDAVDWGLAARRSLELQGQRLGAGT